MPGDVLARTACERLSRTGSSTYHGLNLEERGCAVGSQAGVYNAVAPNNVSMWQMMLGSCMIQLLAAHAACCIGNRKACVAIGDLVAH